MRSWRMIAAAAGLVLVGWVAEAGPPPPVLRNLGLVNPTPVPTEKAYEKKRLITSLTVQNSPEGDTIITFEASDVGRLPDGKFRPIASERYTLTEVKPAHRALKDDAVTELRRLEEALLRYVEAKGGPRDRSQIRSGSERPQ